METFYASYFNGMCTSKALYTLKKKIKKIIDTSAYAKVLEKCSYVGIRQLTREGVTGP